ncbi:regulatory particle non-ATPase [Malassezia yamatoensis]|uniref:Regulatory particle non-ATPase n=1 Tax=Malassezia yamatoensis TaxID=253288 RepID=A0AAJ6CIF3_9BASI|nr:regulatory particle non-ATPase [Malassezia yamatoensis]
MTVDTELREAHQKLVQSYQVLQNKKQDTDVQSLSSQLAIMKIMLAERELFHPDPSLLAEKDVDALVIARDVFEIGTLSSLRAKDLESFDRFWSQLKPFYLDLATSLPASSNYEPIIGLSLLRSLSSNRISEFHMALEMLPAALVRDSPCIQHPVLLERWLMEGSFSNVWRERANVPREEFLFFVDILMDTIRHEIASCEEKAYDTLPLNDVATLLFFTNQTEVLDFAKERNWHINPTTQAVEFAGIRSEQHGAQAEDRIPRRTTIASNMHFARELESIV